MLFEILDRVTWRLERITKKMLWEYFIVVVSGVSTQRILVVVSLKY